MAKKKKTTRVSRSTRGTTRSSDSRRGAFCWRGGEKLGLKKLTDRFTVRLARGVDPASLAATYDVEAVCSLGRQRLEEFHVSSSRCNSIMKKLRAEQKAEFVSHVYAFASDPTSRLYLTDEIMVQFQPHASDEEIENVSAEQELEWVKAVAGLERAYVFRVTSRAVENPVKIANRLRESAIVLECEANMATPVQTFHEPDDALFGEQWHLHHEGGPFLRDGSHIDAVRAWEVTRGERDVVVAIADDSCDISHGDFQGRGKLVAPRDFQGRDFSPAPEGPADNHGTACAGLAVAEENGRGVVGVAPGCALMPVRTSAFLDDASIEDLFDWVREQGASVVSCSWGSASNFFPLSVRQKLAIRRAATEGRGGRGCVIVFAAGNANRPVDGTVTERGWPQGLFRGKTRWLAGFAAHEDVMAVSACSSDARKSSYSNWGDEISVCAPSSNGHPGIADPRNPGASLPTFPTVSGTFRGRGVVTTDRVGRSGYSGGDYTRNFGGTSSACPVVAGVAALVLSANSKLTAAEVREVIEGSADKIEDGSTDPQLGTAFGEYDGYGHSAWFGFGRVNAYGAVTEAVQRLSSTRSQKFTQASAPGLAIVDNDSSGRSDTLVFSEQAVVEWVSLSVDLSHTWRGDLRLVLITPSGGFVVLHDREGGSANDLRRRFDPTTTPGLGALAGQQLAGEWTLHVQDLATRDTGVLNSWSIEVQGRPQSVIELDEAPGETIPDSAAAGIERTMRAVAPGQVQSVDVTLDITHTFIRDLRVVLTSPTGTEVVLHDRTGGSRDNIERSYSVANLPALENFQGEDLRGEWRLNVADLEGRDMGKLNRWALRIERLVTPSSTPFLREPEVLVSGVHSDFQLP